MFYPLKLFLGPALAALTVTWAFAGPVRIEHQPIEHNRAELVVAGANGEVRYNPDQLERLGFRRLTTVTPWRDIPAAFDGVLLSDILAANGLGDASAITVEAENGYAVEIPAQIWKRWPVLVATRVNGRPHGRRQRGPIQFILPMSDDAATGASENEAYWVWMAARIEPVN